MGNTPSEIRAAAKAGNGENENMANDALNTMGKLAKEKMENFRLRVASNADTHEVPIDKMIYQNQLICCSVSEDDKKLTGTVKELVGNLTTGKYVDALVVGANAMLNALFGQMVATDAEHNFYRIIVGPLGGIRRIDINLYLYAFTSNTMINLAKNVLVSSIVVSSVDCNAIDISTLRVAIEQSCGDDVVMGKKLLRDVLYEWTSEKEYTTNGIIPRRLEPPYNDDEDDDDEVYSTKPQPLPNKPVKPVQPMVNTTEDSKPKKRKLDNGTAKENSIRRDTQGPNS